MAINKNTILVIIAIQCIWAVHSLLDPLYILVLDEIFGNQIYGIVFLLSFVPYSIIWIFQLFLIFAWKTIWERHFCYRNISWYYRLALIAQSLLFVWWLFFSFFMIIGVADIANTVNSIGNALQEISGKAFSILRIIVFLQFISFANSLYGIKSWFIGINFFSTLIVLIGVDSWIVWLPRFSIELILLIKIYKSFYKDSVSKAEPQQTFPQ